MKVLFDTNVILDALTDRYSTSFHGKNLLNAIFSGKITGYLLTSQVTDIYYTLRKYYDSEGKKRRLIKAICETFILLSPLKSNLLKCVESSLNDYEDALIDDVAKVNCIDYIVTSNYKDFLNSSTTILKPSELDAIIETMSSKDEYPL